MVVRVTCGPQLHTMHMHDQITQKVDTVNQQHSASVLSQGRDASSMLLSWHGWITEKLYINYIINLKMKHERSEL
jgi:hypothetical protein